MLSLMFMIAWKHHKFQPETLLVTKLILDHKNKTNKEMEMKKEVNLNVSHALMYILQVAY
jgi:hypothetical protein